jgi:thiol:disulfide interchange protein
MRRLLFTLIFLSLLIGACSSSPPPSPTAPSPAPKAAVQAAPATTKYADLKDFVASDPALVGSTGRPQMIEFFAFWCITCQSMRQIVHELQDEYATAVDFVYLDIDAENTKTLQRDLTFTGLRPTIIFLDAKGQEKARLVGVHTKAEIANKLDELAAVGG